MKEMALAKFMPGHVTLARNFQQKNALTDSRVN